MLDFIRKKSRYKIAYGGRGSGKSWSFALTFVRMACQQDVRVLCTRELQTSLRSSVHQLLRDTIIRNGLLMEFKITMNMIRHTRTGAFFIFAGLKNNPEAVKSTEGLTHVWIEEGQTISEESMSLLIPSVRGQDSEIWITMNPRYEKDHIYSKFIAGNHPEVFKKKVNWQDNPWFPTVLEVEKQYDYETNHAMYLHTWEGELRPYGERPLFDPAALVRGGTELSGGIGAFGLDLSYSGKSALVGISISEAGDELFILQASSRTRLSLPKITEFLGEIDNTVVVDNARPEVIDLMRESGYTVRRSKKGAGSVLRGADRMARFRHIHFAPDTEDVLDEFSRLGWDESENLIGDRDFFDATRYALEVLEGKMKIITFGELAYAG